MKPTVVQLSGGTPEGSTTVSFEEAFGDYSEARGKGRARRHKRKTERQQNRIVRRGARKSARQQNREAQMEARQQRKTTRHAYRDARKGGEESEPEAEPQTPLNQEGDSAPDNQGNGEGEYQGEGGGESANDEGQNQSEGGAESEQSTEDAEVDGEQGESDDASGFTGELGFDGIITMSPEDRQWTEWFSSAEGSAAIKPRIKLLSRRIEQHKEIISRLQSHLADKGGSDSVIENKIAKNKAILNNLENDLAGFSSFGGDYSNARGGKSGVAKRRAEVRAAKKEARADRKAARKAAKAEHKAERQERRAAKRGGDGGSETPVEKDLNPEFSEQRIEVPAAEEGSGFSGTGLIGLDEQHDIDAPVTRKFDLKFSQASGEPTNHNVRNIVIGVGLGVLAIYLIKKYKVLGK